MLTWTLHKCMLFLTVFNPESVEHKCSKTLTLCFFIFYLQRASRWPDGPVEHCSDLLSDPQTYRKLHHQPGRKPLNCICTKGTFLDSPQLWCISVTYTFRNFSRTPFQVKRPVKQSNMILVHSFAIEANERPFLNLQKKAECTKQSLIINGV